MFHMLHFMITFPISSLTTSFLEIQIYTYKHTYINTCVHMYVNVVDKASDENKFLELCCLPSYEITCSTASKI